MAFEEELKSLITKLNNISEQDLTLKFIKEPIYPPELKEIQKKNSKELTSEEKTIKDKFTKSYNKERKEVEDK